MQNRADASMKSLLCKKSQSGSHRTNPKNQNVKLRLEHWDFGFGFFPAFVNPVKFLLMRLL